MTCYCHLRAMVDRHGTADCSRKTGGAASSCPALRRLIKTDLPLERRIGGVVTMDEGACWRFRVAQCGKA